MAGPEQSGSRDDRILVTGGLTGIGQGCVDRYGDRCIVWSRRTGVDVTDAASVARATADLVGAPYALLHCVGDFAEVPLLESDPEHFAHMVESNLTSTWTVLRHVVPSMVAAGRGRVVCFTAAGADTAGAKTRAPVYFAAKAAVASMASSLAAEVASSGVTVNVIAPGIIRHAHSHAASQERMAPRVPLGRTGTVADLVGAIDLLLSERGAYITGATITIDGGLSL